MNSDYPHDKTARCIASDTSNTAATDESDRRAESDSLADTNSSMSRDNSYKTILKRISAFGGVQIVNILANLVRGKFAALLLGPAGMGISSLYNNAAVTLQQFAGLGLNLSLVKEVAATKDDPSRSAEVLSVATRMILFTALLGFAVCLTLSPWLSEWSFGSDGFTGGFALLSFGVGLSIAAFGYLALLQGLSEVARISKASLVGSLTGVLAGVPLYYFFGTRGIVPAIVLISLSLFLFYYINFKKAVRYHRIPFSWTIHNPMARRFVALGLIFMVGTLSATLTGYLINLFVRYFGSIDDVGFFQAGSSLTNQYMGVIFSALAMDYFPRLSAAADDLGKMKILANRQTEIIVLIATPLALLLIATAPIIIRMLLSSEFLVIRPLVKWLAFGVLLQTLDFPLGYYFLAKDHKKGYFWLEVVGANLLWIGFSTAFYLLFGLIGLGISLVARSVVNVFLSYIVCRRVFAFNYTRRTLLTVAASVMLGGFGFAASLHSGVILADVLMWSATGLSIVFSGILLKRRLRRE